MWQKLHFQVRIQREEALSELANFEYFIGLAIDMY